MAATSAQRTDADQLPITLYNHAAPWPSPPSLHASPSHARYNTPQCHALYPTYQMAAWAARTHTPRQLPHDGSLSRGPSSGAGGTCAQCCSSVSQTRTMPTHHEHAGFCLRVATVWRHLPGPRFGTTAQVRVRAVHI